MYSVAVTYLAVTTGADTGGKGRSPTELNGQWLAITRKCDSTAITGICRNVAQTMGAVANV